MDLATIQDWLKAERDKFTAPDHLCALDALAKTLESSESPSAVVTMITTAYSCSIEQPLKDSDIDRMLKFWVMLCDAARTFGSAQGRLIDLVHEFSTLPDTNATDGSLANDKYGASSARVSVRFVR